MKEILIPLNFTTTPVLYDSKQSFSASDESSGVLTFTTTANVTGTVASLTIRNASDNANRQTILVERLDINSSPFSYIIVKPLPFGNYEGEITLKKGTQIVASAVFLFGVNSSLSASVLPKLVEAYSLDALVEEVETEVSNLKDAYTVTVSETVKGVNKTESTLQAQENVRYLNEHTRKNNNSLWKAQAEAFALAEENRVIEFNDLVDSAVIEQTVTQEVAEKYQEIEATQANRLLSVESELADTLNKSAITLTHMFADNTARDAYFVTHPAELVDLQFIKVGTGYQQYIEGVWTDSVPIVSEQLSATNQPIVDTGNYFATDNTNAALQELGAHKASTSNPHGVTKAQVGLGNVDNTSDANKPVSTAQQTALNAALQEMGAHKASTTNPHGVTKTQVGLGNVDNTSDANKPVSTAQQTALNAKANKVQEAWITPTLLNGWVNFGAGYAPPGYFKDEFGCVQLQGTIKSGTVGQPLFSLPIGYRPPYTMMYICLSNGGVGYVYVSPNGNVTMVAGSTAYVSLDNIRFRL